MLRRARRWFCVCPRALCMQPPVLCGGGDAPTATKLCATAKLRATAKLCAAQCVRRPVKFAQCGLDLIDLKMLDPNCPSSQILEEAARFTSC